MDSRLCPVAICGDEDHPADIVLLGHKCGSANPGGSRLSGGSNGKAVYGDTVISSSLPVGSEAIRIAVAGRNVFLHLREEHLGRCGSEGSGLFSGPGAYSHFFEQYGTMAKLRSPQWEVGN